MDLGKLALAGVAAAAIAALSACDDAQQSASTLSAAPRAATPPLDPHNPLIGSWRFVNVTSGPSDSPTDCTLTMTFTSSQWTQTQGHVTSEMPVTYMPSPTSVYVVDPGGGHTTYNLVDTNHITLNSIVPCAYERVT
jgi:hypothetical protein